MDMKKIIMICCILGMMGLAGCSENHTSVKDIEPAEIPLKYKNDAEYDEIFDILKHNDSLLFDFIFNQCDTNRVRQLTSGDFEFYHDQSGVTDSQESFILSIVGLCSMNYKASRELEPKSLTLHLLRNNREVYGAIQNGKHRFYGEEEDKPKYLTSTAEFTHLWLIEEGNWKLKRVLSFNHQTPAAE
jgi:hypothetical protein